jgi:hypothetical protein
MTVDSSVRVDNLNADQIDGQDSSAFLGVNAKAADSELLDGRELNTGRVTRDLPPSIGGGAFPFLQAGALSLVWSCARDASGRAVASVRVHTTQAGSTVSAHSVQLGGVERPTLNPRDNGVDIASTGYTTAPVVDHASYSAVAPNGDTLQGEVFAGANV